MAFPSPYPRGEEQNNEKLSGYIPTSTFRFFEGMQLGYGYKTFIIHAIFTKLETECKRVGLEPVWDLDNEEKLLSLLKKLNFRTPEEVLAENQPTPTKPKRRSNGKPTASA